MEEFYSWTLVLLTTAFYTPGTMGTLSVYHTHSTTIHDITTLKVEGVATLNLGSEVVYHYFDCNTTGSNRLTWVRGEGGPLRFSVAYLTSINGVRMNMTGFDYPDIGTYTCRDTGSGESVSINMTGDAVAINPKDPNPMIRLGGTICLSVYVAMFSPVRSEISWYKPRANKLTSEGRLLLTDGNKTLIIRNVEIEDGGTYIIEYKQPFISLRFLVATATINLVVTVTPSVVSSPSSNTVLEHNCITFHCEFSGTPLPNIEWMKEGGDLPVMSRTEITTSPNGTTMVSSVFVIEEVMYSDQGRYRCVATNMQAGGLRVSENSLYGALTVIPKLLLEVRVDGTNVSYQSGLIPAPTGTRVEIRCKGSGTLTWDSSSGSNIPVDIPGTNTNTYQHYDSTSFQLTLYIQSFSFDDVATYTCRSDLTSSDNSNLTESVFITNSDPALYIAERVIFTTMGSTAQITAAIYSSNPSILTIKWYHANTLIDIDNNPRYSVTQNGSFFYTYTLNVMNVDESVLGWYRIVVTVGAEGRNETESVRLNYPDPPTSTISPPSFSVSEGERVQFQCLANGTNPHTTWTLEGGVPLPSGVVQDVNNLVIDSASRNLAGRYDCTVNNSGGSAKSTATLTVYYPPMARITHETFGHSSIGGVLRVIAEEGDPSPTFSCSSDGLPIPIITWSGQNGELPNDVILSMEQTSTNLVWNRRLEYTDSGLYECTAQNSQGSSVTRMDLLVRKSPRIETIFPTRPVTSSSSLNFIIPVGYTGTILTCVASGWPTPTIHWLRHGQLLDGGILSDSTSMASLGIVSSRLRGNRAFSDLDVGYYTCIVQANDTDAFHSTDVYLNLSTSTPEPVNNTECKVGSTQTFFHIRVLNTDCVTWVGDMKEHISDSFSEEVMNVVVVECSECSIMTDNIVISNSPTCSNQVEGAALFRGSITTSEVSLTENIFCALKRWQETEPLIAINNQLYQVDKRCNLESDSLTSSECSGYSTRTDKSNTIIYIAIGGGVGVAILVILLAVISCFCGCLCRAKIDYSLKRDLSERTTHGSDGTSLIRYTTQVNPEQHNSQEPPIYSTLNRNSTNTTLSHQDSSPTLSSPNTLVHSNSRQEISRISRTWLLGDTSDGGIFNGGGMTGEAVGTGKASNSGRQVQHMKNNTTLSTDQSLAHSTRPVRAMNPTPPNPTISASITAHQITYEQVDREYRPSEYPSHEATFNNQERVVSEEGISTDNTWQDSHTDYTELEGDERLRQVVPQTYAPPPPPYDTLETLHDHPVSGSSMLKNRNGASSQVMTELNGNEGLSEHIWYLDTSDFSLNQTDMAMRSSIEPYSQVYNYEIEARSEEEMNPVRVPRFSLSQNSAMPYIEAVASVTSTNKTSYLQTTV